MAFVDIEPLLNWTCGDSPADGAVVEKTWEREPPAIVAVDDDDDFSDDEEEGGEFGSNETDDFADFDEDDFDDDFDDEFEDEVEGEYELDDEEYPGDILGGKAAEFGKKKDNDLPADDAPKT